VKLTETEEAEASWAYDGIKPISLLGFWLADSDLVLDSVNFQSSEARAMFIVWESGCLFGW